jgi:hypothetical protein
MEELPPPLLNDSNVEKKNKKHYIVEVKQNIQMDDFSKLTPLGF